MPHNLIEELEPRLVFSVPLIGGTAPPAAIQLRGGILTINGTKGPDRISFVMPWTIEGGHFQVHLRLEVNGRSKTFTFSEVGKIVIDTGAGDDVIKLQPVPRPCPQTDPPTICADNIFTPGPALIIAGAGDDTIVGGDRDDTIDGGGGDDLIYGAGGNDRIFGRDGNDRIYAGTGTDRVFGGAGKDTAWDAEASDNSTERVVSSKTAYTF